MDKMQLTKNSVVANPLSFARFLRGAEDTSLGNVPTVSFRRDELGGGEEARERTK